MNFINAKRFDLLEFALDGTNKRHEAISNNVANVNTPGYKREYVEFESVLQNKVENFMDLDLTHNKHIEISEVGGIDIKKEEDYYTRRDENNINIDKENADMAKNSIMYNALVRQMSGQLNRLRTVIRDGR
jgi:flagellar basal-body rod protein FlgB